MLKKLLLVVTTLCFSYTLFASHIAGGEITYECLGGNQYRFHLNLYVDCAGIDLDEFQSLNFESTCGETMDLDMTLTNPGGTEISQLCYSEINNTNCRGGSLPGMLGFYFTGVMTLNPCDSWIISWSDCCRNDAVVNIEGPGSAGHFIEAVLNSVTAACNNSPVFVNEPIPYTCTNQKLHYSFGVSESDSDSIRYSLIGARADLTSDLTYEPGFSPTSPIIGLELDSITGLVTFTPDAIGNYVVVVLIEEFDNAGNLIGSILRDIQFVVQDCVNNVPNAADGNITNLSGNAIQTQAYALSICNGSSFSFDAIYGDPDAGDSLFVTTNITSILPGAQFVVTGVNPLNVSISADLNSLTDNAVIYFEVNIRDNACPVVGRQDFVYEINVLKRTIALKDTTICGTQEAELSALFGNTFTWAVISGDPINVGTNFSCNPCANPLAKPNMTTVYEVTSDLSTGCVNKDTVTVTLGTDFTSTLTTTVDPSFCSLHKASLVIDNQPADTYTYSWTNAAFLDDATIANPETNMQPAGTYEFIYTTRNPSGCVKMDSVTLTSVDVPSFTVSGDTMLCVGESSELVVNKSLDMLDDFNTTLNTDLWADVNGAQLNTDCGSVSGNALHFDTDTRIAETKPLNTSSGGTVSFDILIGSDFTPCEDADFGEDVFLEYSIDGGANWINMGTFLADNFISFTNVSITIPPGAISPATLFRWSQPDNSGTGSDNWAIDNINFDISQDLSAYTMGWYDASSTLLSTQDTLSVSPVVETTYYYRMINGAASCEIIDSITVHVSPIFGFLSSIDTAACVPDVFSLHSTPDVAGDYTFSWAPNIGLSSSTDSLVNVNLTQSVNYGITVTSVNGCTQIDSIKVHMTNLTLPVVSGDTTICLGESTTLSVIQLVNLSDDFNGAAVNGSLWELIEGGLLSTDCGAVSGNALHFDDDFRTATTIPLNTTAGGTLTFNLIIGSNSAPCEQADAGDDVILEYSLDGGTTWILLNTFFPTDFSNFTQVTVPIPPAAMSASTKFRWSQPINAGLGSDNWALDDVTVEVSSDFPPNSVVEWFDGPLLLATNDSVTVSPLVNTFYRFVLRDTITECFLQDSVRVRVGNPFTLTSPADQIFCTPTPVNFVITPSVPDDYNFAWTPSTGLSSTTDSTVTANPASSVSYAIEVMNPGGCSRFDTINVFIANLTEPTLIADTMLCIGDSTFLTMIPVQTFEDNFDGTVPNPDLWDNVGDGTFNTDCGSVSGSALHFDGFTREAETVDFNTTSGGTITFDLIIGSGFSPCEEADPGEDVILEYSLDGGLNWILIDTYITTDFGSFTQVVANIPPGAMSSATRFRWSQPDNSGSGSDNWAIDNVVVEIGSTLTPGSYTSEWFDSGSQIGSLDSVLVKPTATTTYNYVFTDNFSSCSVSSTITVQVSQGFTLSSTANDTVCLGSVFPMSTTPSDPGNYTYSWTPTTALSSPNGSSTNATVNAPIEYFVTAVSDFGCRATDSVEIFVFPPFTVAVSGDNSICEGDSSILSATGADSYIWDNTGTLSSGVDSVVTATPANTTTYTVIGTVGSCTASTTFTLTVNPLPTILTTAPADITCLNPSSVLTATSAGNTIVWDGPGMVAVPDPATATEPGTYTVTVTTPATGCVTTGQVTVNEPNPLLAAFTASPITGVSPLQVQFDNGSQNAVSYEWYFGENALVGAITEDAAHNYGAEGSFTAMLVATNALGCTDTAFVTILVLNPILGCGQYVIQIPNVITANGDGINESLTINHNISSSFGFECLIVNRWGNVVYETNDFTKPWDGKNKSGELCSEGVYFYKMTFTCDSQSTSFDGNIQLITH